MDMVEIYYTVFVNYENYENSMFKERMLIKNLLILLSNGYTNFVMISSLYTLDLILHEGTENVNTYVYHLLIS